MKKTLIILFAVIAIFMCTAVGCTQEETTYSIVCTIFPEYDWVREITNGAEDVSVKLLLDKGVDLHSYDPTISDISTIKNSRVFIYIGGESDKWAPELLSSHPNENRTEINLLSVLGEKAVSEETVGSMEEEEEEEESYDEHVWLSVKNASFFVRYIADKLIALDEKNADLYRTNADNYIAKLNGLDEEYASCVQTSRVKTLLFADRFPFRYMVEDYDLSYDAAFAGCSSNTEITPATILSLAKTVDDNGLKYVVILEGTKEESAQNVISRTKDKNQEVLILNSLQTVTGEQAKTLTYFGVMQSNLEVLKKALS